MEKYCKYKLIDIFFEQSYVLPEEDSYLVREDGPDDEPVRQIMYDADGVPFGRTKEEIKIREKLIKDFYAKWIADHPSKAIFNKNLKSDILIKYLSINETYSKASRSYQSTLAVFNLTEILENAELVEEVVPKRNNNQKQFEKVLYMRYKDVKLTVGVQRTTQEKVQYCITVPQK